MKFLSIALTGVLRIRKTALIGVFLAASTSYGSPIFVTNFSFETLPLSGLPGSCGTNCAYSTNAYIPGWTVSDTSVTGQFQPGPPTNTTFFNSVPDGTTTAFSNGGSTISQTVAPLVQLGIVYTLMVDVGVRKDFGVDPGTEALEINGNEYFATGTPAALGDWSIFTATYTGTAADVGSSITIQLASSGPGGTWDNVQLNDSTTPEPATGVLIGLGSLALAGVVRRKSLRKLRGIA